MKIFFEGPNGLESVELEFSKLSEQELEVYAMMGVAEARKELKNRIGFDQFKAPEEYTEDDAKFYDKWLKNQASMNRDKIVEGSDQ